MKKESFHSRDSEKERDAKKDIRSHPDASGGKLRESGKDVSLTDLDNILFTKDDVKNHFDRGSISLPYKENLDDIPTDRPQTIPAPPKEEPRMRIEDATPIPAPEEPVRKPALPDIDLSRKLTDLRSEFKKKKAKSQEKNPDAAFFGKFSGKSDADITRAFVPANRIDDKGNILPEKPEETTGVNKPRMTKADQGPFYTILLAYNRRIHFKKTIEICSGIMNIPPQETERRIRFGKGVLFEHVDEEKALYLQKQFLNISQGVRIVEENESSCIPDSKDVIVWLFSKRHFQVQTEKEKLTLPWEGVQLLCSGNVRFHFRSNTHKKILDVIGINPFVRLRVWDATFDYKSSGITQNSSGKTNFIDLIKIISRFSGKARLSPTIMEMLEKNIDEPRNFGSIEEFDNYIRWLFLSFYGKPLR
ncbi:hypothetical protein JW926_12795 [Candidatus Sumerlaeota bacterium]|nr:hypothetical protein [Candidatus Sumerlaeota bacterium]